MAKMRIGDLFELEKGSLQSSKCTEGEFDFITAAKEWKTHNEFSHDIEALIFAAMASGSLGRTHYVNGKFITSDLCYILTPKDSKKYPIDLKFYHFVFNSLKDEIVKNTKSGTSKESINQTNLKNYEIPYFDIEQQHFWIERLINTKITKEDLVSEIETQQTLLKKLRQSILQEAIEGKLTASWREQNPDAESASVLLEKIKAEKEQLIKEKKIKNQKPLPAINEAEIPFDIPDGWEWCRTSDACTYIVDCPHSTPKFVDNGFKCIDTTCINMDGEILDNKIRMVSEKTFIERNNRLIPQLDDIIYSREGIVGQAVIVPKKFPICLGQRVMLFRTYAEIPSKFFRYVVTSRFFLQEMLDRHRGIGAKHVNMKDLRESIIPLPPLEEQKEIVKKIENLFKICDELEDQINSSKVNSETLMQSVLKEAFEK